MMFFHVSPSFRHTTFVYDVYICFTVSVYMFDMFLVTYFTQGIDLASQFDVHFLHNRILWLILVYEQRAVSLRYCLVLALQCC